MADITKCSGILEHGEKCPLRDRCYRFTAEAYEYGQSYFTKVPGYFNPGFEFACDVFWNTEKLNGETK